MSRAQWAAAVLVLTFAGSLTGIAVLLAASPAGRGLLFFLVAGLVVVGIVVALFVRWLRKESAEMNRRSVELELELEGRSRNRDHE